MKNCIRTLAQLKKRKQQLMIQKEASKQLFFDSLTNTRKSTIEFLTKKVILPVGVTGVAAWGASKLFSNGNDDSNGHYNADETDHSSTINATANLIQQLLPLGSKILMAYLGKKAIEEANN